MQNSPHNLAIAYRAQCVMSTTIGQMSFERCVAHIKQIHVLRTTRRLLEHLVHYSTNLDGTGDVEINPRLFLLGYSIVHFTNQIFDATNPLMAVTRAKAETLIQRFEAIVNALETHRELSDDMCRGFHTHLVEYQDAYNTFRAQDQGRLVAQVRYCLLALYASRPRHVDVTNAETVAQIDRQIERLRTRICMLAGQTTLDEIDQDRTERLDIADEFGHPASKEYMAHELLLDANFRLKFKSDLIPLTRAKADAYVRPGNWASVLEDMRSASPSLHKVRRIVRNIMDEFSMMKRPLAMDCYHLLSPTDSGRLDQACMRELAQGLANHIRHSIRPDSELVWDTFERLDDEPMDAWFCSALAFITASVHLTRTEVANARWGFITHRSHNAANTLPHRLALLAPVIRAHGADYERSKFDARLASGEVTLERTAEWIRQSAQRLFPNVPFTAEAIAVIQNEGLQHLLWDLPQQITEATIPEILRPDMHHLIKLRHELHSIGDNRDDDATRHERVKGIWKRLVDGGALETADAAYAEPFMQRLNAALAQFQRIAAVNREVHAQRYHVLVLSEALWP